MTRLYWKIFLGFWITSSLVAFATVFVIHRIDFDGEIHRLSESQENRSPPIQRLLQQAIRETMRGGRQGVSIWMTGLPEHMRNQLYILDGQQDLLSRRVPLAIENLGDSLGFEAPIINRVVEGRPYLGRFIPLPRTQLKIIVTSPDAADRLLLDILWKNFWPVFLLTLLISGVVCFILARYLTQPVQNLRDATQRVADGDWDYRVRPIMGRRRDELGNLAEDFDAMTERVQLALEEQKRLIKDVSHELRSPLARIQMALGLAEQRQGQGQSVDTELAKIREAADYLENIIADILSLPVGDLGSWELDDAVDLVGLIESQLAFYRDLNQRRVSLEFHAEMEEAVVATHGNTLKSVFDNIISNAINHTAEHSAIHIHLSTQGEEFVTQIRDHGPGVPEDTLEEIFKPFFRVEEARDRQSGGYGLGLAIAWRAVKLHAGQLRAFNHSQGGLVMEVRLPVADFQ